MADILMTPEFRVSFPIVFAPKKNDKGEDRYGVTMLFPKGADLSALKAAATQAAVDEWGADKTKWPKQIKFPFRDQSEKHYDGYEPGAIFVNATSKGRPGLVNRQRDDIIDQTEFYPGCYARATVTFKAYPARKTKQDVVACHVNNIQKLRDGNPLDGRTRAQDDFADDLPPDEGADSSSIF